MGVIKKMLYRGDILGKPRHRNLFLDMEENIHIHFRDLRIEMSREEFEDFAGAFCKQAEELLEIMRKQGYQDGKLPNSNQDDVRIWTESRLRHEVKYHPQRFSLEECGDGYHFHYRNYKVLIDPVDFMEMVRRFRTIDPDGHYASSYEEVLDLLVANEVDFVFDSGNVPGELLAIAVAPYHLPKVRDIFGYIGFTQEIQGKEHHYLGAQLKVVARAAGGRSSLDYRRLRSLGRTVRLADYLARRGPGIDPDELNRIKCQVLDLYFGLKGAGGQQVEVDPEQWLYLPAEQRLIFPYSPAAAGGKALAESLYRAWSALLARFGQGFIKPTKHPFPAAAQKLLRQQVDEAVKKEVAAFVAVDKIYLMGSALRGDMGAYLAPFVHGRMAKLGSDIDILVEIDPEREGDVPAHWQLINKAASNHCAVYHIGQIPLAEGVGEWPQKHPNLEFTQHLIDAYVFFPSHGYREEKDAFLRKFGAKLFYDRSRDGLIRRGGKEDDLGRELAALYGFSRVNVEKIKASTENAVFKVFVPEADHILKLFKVSGNYNRARIAEHTVYEKTLVEQLVERGIPTASIIPLPDGGDAWLDGCPALLFERIAGEVQQRPEYDLDRISAALAAIHRTQLERPLALDAAFTFDEVCMIWLPQFQVYLDTPGHSQEIAEAFAGLAPLVQRFNPGDYRAGLYERSPAVHCHGDVTPKNVIIDRHGEARFFDFNNAFYGPRMVDVVDGAFEFSLAEKYIDLADFSRFDTFLARYGTTAPLAAAERDDLGRWIELMGVIKFTKEIRVLSERPAENLRRRRALAIAGFVLSRMD